MAEVFANNASTTLVGTITATSTSLTIQTQDGPEFPTLSGSDFFRVCMINKSTGQMEIAKVTTHAAGSSTLDFGSTSNRGIESTTALALNDGDVIELRPTAAFFDSMATDADIQDQAGNYALDTGIADAYVVTLSPIPTGYGNGLPLRVKCVNANTGASTINVNGLGTKSIKKNVSEALEAGDILAGQVIELVYDGTNFQMVSGGTPSSYDSIILDVAAAPTPGADQAAIFAKDDSGGVANVNIVDENGVEMQLPFEKDTKMMFYQAAAPTGWTLVALGNTYGIIVEEAGNAGGTSGTNDPVLNDKIPTHNHTASSSSDGDHTHTIGYENISGGGSGYNLGRTGLITGYNGSTSSDGSHSHTITVDNNSGGGNWVPRHAMVRIASKD